MQAGSLHSFHIPVMGLAYTIDTPIKVARFGINSVISIIQDNLIEKMRSYYYPKTGKAYHPITSHETDYRARRITDYLNLVNTIVSEQVEKLKSSAFEAGSEICKYFEMLPDDHELKYIYLKMLSLHDNEDKHQLQNWLRHCVKPGSINVNIMTKLDKNNHDNDGHVIDDGSDAVAALRGYVQSNLTNSSVVLSAGMNPRLFAYMEKCPEFDANSYGVFEKKIIVKVSDYRSAFIQGKMLAKKGLWVSEFRIESGLNCGGHAFATDGYLLGPILEEFKERKEELVDTLFTVYNETLKAKGKTAFIKPHHIKITVQGGVGTSEEDKLLRKYYGVDSTGWGTPFLLVPEATTVDERTLSQLCRAKEADLVLSKKSPLGVRFHYLKDSTAEHERIARIKSGKPGSPCTEKFLVANTEFGTEPICTASRTYQKQKIKQLQSMELSEEEYKRQLHDVLDKECLCVGLSNAAVKLYQVKPFKKLEGVNICPGPNIAYFSEVVSLQKMVDHIYGRTDIIRATDRPHMFIKELMLYVDFWQEFLTEAKEVIDVKRKAYIENFHKNLIEGISYYRHLSDKMTGEWNSLRDKFLDGLTSSEKQLEESLRNFKEKVLAPA